MKNLSEQKIATPCPSCKGKTLFVGTGGHLTCGWLECKEPVVETKIAQLEAKNKGLEEHKMCTLTGRPLMNCPRCNSNIDYAWTMKPRYDFDDVAAIRMNKFALVHCPKCEEIYNVHAPGLYDISVAPIVVKRGHGTKILADDKEIVISVLKDGTVNICTPDGGITKIWPSLSVASSDET